MTQIKAYGCVLITILLTVYGQLVIKWQVSSQGKEFYNIQKTAHFYFSLLTNLWVISAFLGAFLASLAWMAAMSKLPLSGTYPVMSLTFPIVMLLSCHFFGESINSQQIISVVLIMTGIMLLGIK